MSKSFFPLALQVSLFCLVSAVFAPAGWPEELSKPTQASVDEAVSRVKPALVRIHVVSAEYTDGREIKVEATGSGAIISKDGYIVTNHHVAGHAKRIFCTLSNKEEIEATLVGADPLTDIAVIKLNTTTPREFPSVSFGDSAQVQVGEPVLAMGCPMALSQSVTLGIVSNVEMIAPEWLRAWGGVQQDGEDVGALVKWIGHDAEILPGNSGGPLVNLKGEIIGINEIQMGLGGAIPGNIAKTVAAELIANKKIVRAWLGMSVQAHLKHSAENKGVLVSGVISGSPAATAGLKAGDLLLRIDCKPANVRFSEEMPDFNKLVAALPIGKEIEMSVLRDGKEIALKITPVARENAKPKQHELKPWGITASNISLIKAKQMKRTNQDGALVTSVHSGGPASEAKPALAPQDVIVEVDGKPVKNLQDLEDITKALDEGKKDPVPVLTAFERKTERCVTVVKVGIKEIEDPGLEVKKAWLPIKTQVLTRDIAGQLKHPELKGFIVTVVYPGSSAEKAGLKVGDFILAVDDQKLTASAPEHYEELAALIRQYKEGETVKLSVLRGQDSLVIPVELVRNPKLQREMKEYRDENFDFSVRDISFFDKAGEQWQENQEGVLVSDVKSGGWAALGDVYGGDLILAIDSAKITDIASFEKKMKEIAAAKPPVVVLEVLRGINTLFIELEPKWNTNDQP